MLNRTLSANLNGLNLGTRTLAAPASLNIGENQGVRHNHPRKRKDSMRDVDAKTMRDTSISIRGSRPISPPMSSPFGELCWPYPASPRPTGSQVVVVLSVAVEALESALFADRASQAARQQAQFQPRFTFRGWQQATTTRALLIPVASTATGG